MSTIKQLWQLQEIDTALSEGKKRLGRILQNQTIPSPLIELRHQVSSLSQTLQQSEEAYVKFDADLQEIENDLNSYMGKLYSGNVKKPRELEDLQNKVDSLEKQKGSLEDGILTCFTEMEITQTSLDNQALQLEQREAVWANQLQKLKEEQQEVALQINQYMEKRAAHLPKIDIETQELYNRLLKNKRGLAVAALKQGLCQACRVGVTSNIIRDAQARKIILCSNCGRILYASH